MGDPGLEPKHLGSKVHVLHHYIILPHMLSLMSMNIRRSIWQCPSGAALRRCWSSKRRTAITSPVPSLIESFVYPAPWKHCFIFLSKFNTYTFYLWRLQVIPMNFILMCVADSVFWLNPYFSLPVVAFLYYRGQRTQQHSLESPAALVQACDLSFFRHIFTKCQCGNEQCDFFSPEWKFRFPDKVESGECPSGVAVMEQRCFC